MQLGLPKSDQLSSPLLNPGYQNLVALALMHLHGPETRLLARNITEPQNEAGGGRNEDDSEATPFMLAGAALVLVVISYYLSVW